MSANDPGESLENLKNQAKSLLKSVQANNQDALERIAPYSKDPGNFKLNDAQLVIARERGYKSWTKLKTFLKQSISTFVAAANNGDIDTIRNMLKQEPRLAHAPMALFRAAAMGKMDVVRLLIRQGADVNATVTGTGEYIGTPLLAATEMLNQATESMVTLLLQLGADPDLEAGSETPLSMAMGTYARSPDKHAVIRILLDAGAHHNQPEAVMAIHLGRADLLEAQLDANPQLVHQRFEQVDYLWQPFNYPGQTLLHVAADYNETEIGRLLLSRGADVNARADNDCGQSAIFHTVASWTQRSPQGYCLPFLELLLEHGAKLNARARVKFDTFGASNCESELREVTPLGYALAFEQGPGFRNSQAAVALLRQHGAPAN